MTPSAHESVTEQLNPSPSEAHAGLRRVGHWAHKDALGTQIISASLVSLFLVMLLALAIAGTLTLKDRRAYLLEIQYYKMHTAALSVRIMLEQLPFSQEFRPAAVAPQEVARLYGIPRLPETGEIFVGSLNGSLVAFARRKTADGARRYVTSPAGPLRLCPHFKGVCYAMTSFGTYLSSTTSSYTSANMMELPAVQHFLTNGLAEGQHWAQESEFLPSAVTSYRELPKTNVVLFAESSILEFFYPAARLLASGVLVLFAAAAILLGVLGTRLTTLLRPMAHLLRDFSRLAKGQYELPAAQMGSNELNHLSQGLSAAGRMLQARENAILGLKRDLNGVLNLSHSLALAADAQAVVTAAAEHFIQCIRPEGAWLIEVHIFKGEAIPAGPLARARLQATLSTGGEAPHLISPVRTVAGTENSAQERFQAAAARAQLPSDASHLTHICCPVVYQGAPVGLFVFSCAGLRALEHAERLFLQHFTDTLAAALSSVSARAELHDKAVIDIQLRAAGAIQSQFAPHVPHQLGSLRWKALFRPAEKVGGDFYTVNLFGDGRWALFFVGDATGHGIESALLTGVTYGLMATTQAMFARPEFARAKTPAPDVLKLLATLMSDTIERAGQHKVWMTACFIAIDTVTGAGHYLSAGHPPALLFNPESETKSLRLQNCLLGDGLFSQWTTAELILPPGGALVIYSDGLVENHLPGEEPTKIRKISGALAKEMATAQAPPEPDKLLNTITQAVPHLRHPPQRAADDTTLLVITRNS